VLREKREHGPGATLYRHRAAEGSATMYTRLFFGTTQPGKSHEAVRMLADFAKRVKEQKGYVLGQVLYSADEIVGITSWRTKEELAAYADSELARELFARIMPLLLGVPKVQSYEVEAFEKGADE
jgi:heme-degrading monooxygenase HmoA